MACEECESIAERFDVPHVIRKCKGCGRDLHIAEPGEHGRGVRVEAGDRFVIPEGWIRLSLDPLKATVRLSEAGLQMVAKMMFVKGLPKERDGFEAAAKELEDYADKVVMESPLTVGLDINKAGDVEAIFSVLAEKGKETAAWWAYWLGQFLVMSRDARTANDALGAAWAQAWAERMRWMLIYKEQLEVAVVMGHSARRLVDTLAIWDGNKKTDNEEFWQVTFNENSYVLSQVFAVPVVFIQDKAYVGGMKIGRDCPDPIRVPSRTYSLAA